MKRIQLSLSFDEYSQLLERVKKHCKSNHISLTDFTASALEKALEQGLEARNVSETIEAKVSFLEAKLEVLSKGQEQIIDKLNNKNNAKAIRILIDALNLPANTGGAIKIQIKKALDLLIS